MIQIINKIGGSMTVKILNMIKTIAVIYVIIGNYTARVIIWFIQI